MPCLCEIYPGICLTTEEKAWRNLIQGSRRMPADTMKICKHTIIIISDTGGCNDGNAINVVVYR
jgi:hypothetical protein